MDLAQAGTDAGLLDLLFRNGVRKCRGLSQQLIVPGDRLLQSVGRILLAGDFSGERGLLGTERNDILFNLFPCQPGDLFF